MKKALLSFIFLIILGVGVSVAYLDSRASRIAEHNARIMAAQEAMPAPTVVNYDIPPEEGYIKCKDEFGNPYWSLVCPTPTPIKPAKIAPKQAQKPVEVANTECKDISGNIFMTTLEKCLAYHEQNKPQPTSQPQTQPSYNYDYYVPSYSNYEAPSFYVAPPPPMPAYETYKPNYPTANIESKPFPTIGPSIPQYTPECYQIGDKTVCK